MTDARLVKAVVEAVVEAVEKMLSEYGPHLLLDATSYVFAVHASRSSTDPAYAIAYRSASNSMTAALKEFEVAATS